MQIFISHKVSSAEMHTVKLITCNVGGSDYTAFINRAAIDATEIQIWTDIDGLHNNDPPCS